MKCTHLTALLLRLLSVEQLATPTSRVDVLTLIYPRKIDNELLRIQPRRETTTEWWWLVRNVSGRHTVFMEITGV